MSLNVLVVEDEELVRKSIIKALLSSGLKLAEIREAENGLQALEQIHRHHFDLVLIDYHLPLLNGEELVQSMRRDASAKRVPVVFISGENQRGKIEELKANDAGFIAKPFSPTTLGEAVINLIS